MALMINSLNSTQFSNLHSISFINSFSHNLFQSNHRRTSCLISLSSRRNFAVFQGLNNGQEVGDGDNNSGSVMANPSDSETGRRKRLSEQSSWEAKDAFGNDYLYRLGAEADNTNITVGARAGVIDDLFAGNFLGRDADIVFDYRQKVTRSFEYLQGDYYIAPLFLDKVVCHIVKNYIAHLINAKVPLILGIWGGKGQGKTFQTELIFRAMGVEPVIMSAGELESERAGEPGKLIRDRYRAASQVVQNHVRSFFSFNIDIWEIELFDDQ
uniref:Ribulose bisphosphate carboxylase/oxygenase activase, chloroplastic n=1 Tax=Opuntia streptacantha TaxID=393608 RepID=A0A7C9EPG1_OPUST